MDYKIVPYHEDLEREWDRFVMQESANGTFLQTRRFLNYHPNERFQDVSFLVENEKGAMIAAIPAAVQQKDGKRVLISHPGSTYGGPVIRKSYNTAERCLKIIQLIDNYICDTYERAEFKLTPNLLQNRECFALEYAFYHQGFQSYEELNTWVSLGRLRPNELLSSFRQNKKHDVQQANKKNLEFKRMSVNDVEAFYQLLCDNLKKFKTKPIHSIAELSDLMTNRIHGEASLFGVFDDDKLVASTLTFSFVQRNVLHTQYIASDLNVSDYSPSAFLYYKILLYAIESGYDSVSFGISTTDHGRCLNQGLISNKEGYNAHHDINRTYYKDYHKETANE